MPLLILDTICFGDKHDRDATVKEMLEVLSCSQKEFKEKMEVQRAVSMVFVIIETFQSWVDAEIEERFSSRRSLKSYPINRASDQNNHSEKSNWPTDESILVIEALLKAIPSSLCAKAAADVGMFAQSLRYLEIEARKKYIDVYETVLISDTEKSETFNSGFTNTKYLDLRLAHLLFGELNDCDSMNAISKVCKQQGIIEDIREKEANGDWDGVLKLCEQASQSPKLLSKETSQLSRKNLSLEEQVRIAYLKALLELGQLDSALNQVGGMISKSRDNLSPSLSLYNDFISMDLLIPYAVQASWRLSRWDVLDTLLNSPSYKLNPNACQKIDLDGHYHLALGRSILDLHNKNAENLGFALKTARQEIMQSLSVAARENYNRIHPYLLKLHCLREIEDSCSFFCNPSSVHDTYNKFNNLVSTDWHWQSRINSVGSNTTASIDIIKTRLALARLSTNSEVEASLWLEAGKKARKGGLYHLADTCLSHAANIYQSLKECTTSTNRIDIQAGEVILQLAKIKHASGNSTDALLMIKHNEFDGLLLSKSEEARDKEIEAINVDGRLNILVRSALQATEWMVESGLKSGSEVIARYKLLNAMSPKWEQGEIF